MPESYTIEPPQERQREMSRDRKLDRIIDLLSHKESEPDEGGDDHAPEVTFEADPDSLPVEPSVEDETTEDGVNGERTANVSTQVERPAFQHPSAKRRGMER
jgi:hypothetical protein